MKTDARKIPPEAQRDRRLRAFELKDQGMKITEIARVLGVSRWTVHDWFARAITDGREAVIQGRYRGRRQNDKLKLTPEQMLMLQDMLVNTRPKDFGIDHSLWHSSSVRTLLQEKFGVTYSKSGLCALLKRLGFTYQGPTKRAVQADEQAMKEWVLTTYPEIQAEAKERNATIFFQDETSLKQDANWVRGWAPKGDTPVLDVNGRARYGQAVLNIAINTRGQSYFRIQDSAVTGADFRDFLQGLRDEFPGRLLFVICDNASIHKAKEVKAWLEADGLMELKFLPPYAPQLNPVEVFNQTLKCAARMATPKDKEGTKALAVAHIDANRENDGEGFRKCFRHKHTRYAQED